MAYVSNNNTTASITATASATTTTELSMSEIQNIQNNIEIMEIMEKINKEIPIPKSKSKSKPKSNSKSPKQKWPMGSCVVAAKHIINTNKHISYVPLVFRMTQKDYIGGSQYGPTLANVTNFKELMPNNQPCPVHCVLLNQENRKICDPMFELGAPNKEIPIDKYFQELVKKDVIEYDAECKELIFDVEYLSAGDYYYNRASYPEYDFPIAVVKVNVKTYEVKM